MDKYRKVEKIKESIVKDEEEIRVTSAGSVSAYVSRAAKVFGELEKQQVIIKATGNALTKAVTLAEVLKRRFKDLHQITNLTSTEIVDEYEPLEEGLDRVTDTRSLPVIEVTLSKEPLDTSDKGYQPPLDASEVTEFDPEEMSKPRGRGRGKGRGKGKGKGKGKYDDDDDAPKGKGKGKGKGKYEDDEPAKGKGKGKGKDKGKASKGSSKGYDTWEPSYSSSKGKGKDKGKGKGKYSSWDDYGSRDYDRSYGYGSGKSSGKGGKKGKSSSWDDWGSSDYDRSSYSYGGKSSSKGKGKSSKGSWY